MVAFGEDGAVIGEDDMYAQAVQVFRNIEDVLKASGASMDDVVPLTSWLVDMERFADFFRARNEAFPNGMGCNTAVAAHRLACRACWSRRKPWPSSAVPGARCDGEERQRRQRELGAGDAGDPSRL